MATERLWVGGATPGPRPSATTAMTAYDRRRSGRVVTDLLGDFDDRLGSDFYGGYPTYAGKYLSCWAHLLWNLHTFKEDHVTDADPTIWMSYCALDDVQALATLCGYHVLAEPRYPATPEKSCGSAAGRRLS